MTNNTTSAAEPLKSNLAQTNSPSPRPRPAAVEKPCPVCGGEKWTTYVMAPSHYGPEKHQVTKCAACEMIYTNPQSSTYLDEVEQRGVLDRHFASARLEGMQRHGQFLLKLIAPYARGRKFLDFGCGAGGMVHTACNEGWDATGYDLNAGLVEAANRHWNFNALQTGSLPEFYAANANRFDVIISFQVFEHLQEPLVVGRDLFRLLRPGGILLIDVPYVHQPGEWLSRGKTLDPTSHWCHFSIKTLSALMERIGCEVVYRNAAPSLVSLYHRLGFKHWCYPLGLFTKAALPPIGSGVCVIGRKK